MCVAALSAVKIVDILIPDKAIIHSRVRLSCRVDLEEDTLYSLKWYLNGSEVASYMPLRNQSFELFSTREVPISLASETTSTTDLMIRDVTWSCEGTWMCEVFADRSFQKDEKIVQMIVIGECMFFFSCPTQNGNSWTWTKINSTFLVHLFAAPPTESPVIQNSNGTYDMSDIVNVTCISPPAKPHPKLSWLINGETAPSDYVLPFENGTGSQLLFPIQVQHLLQGRPLILITCEASFNYSYSSFGMTICYTVHCDTVELPQN